MAWRRRRYTRHVRVHGKTVNLDTASLADLRKLRRHCIEYNEKLDAYETLVSEVKRQNLHIQKNNELIASENKKKENAAASWKAETLMPATRQLVEARAALDRCRDGVVAKLLSVLSGDRDLSYLTNPTREQDALNRIAVLDEALKEVKQNEPNWDYEKPIPLKELPGSPRTIANLSIGGGRITIDLAALDLEEIDLRLCAFVERANLKKEKARELKAKAAESAKEVRKQARKYSGDLGKQLQVVPHCPYCECALEKNNSHLDHIYPVSKGGQSTRKNLVFCCSECNQNKSDLTLRNFAKEFELCMDTIYENLDRLSKDS